MNEQATSIVTREFGDSATIVGRLAGGLVHETYEVRSDDGDYVLQVSEATPEQEGPLRRGLNCYRQLQNTEIPVPAVETGAVREFDGRKYVLVEKLPGNTGYLDISPERVLNAGKYLAKIHEVWTFENAGWLRFDDRGVSVEEFREGSESQWRRRKVRDNAEYLQANGLEEAGREVARLFDRSSWIPRNARDPALCHNDFTPDNILFRGNEVTGILDFDHAYAGSRHRDIAKAANGFWMHDPCVDWDVRSTFYEGYRAVAELDGVFEETEPKNRVETLAVTVGGMARMGELSDSETDSYTERILEAIDRATES